MPTEKKIDQAFVRLGRVLGRRRPLIPASDVTGDKSRDLPIPHLVDGLPLGEKSFGLGSPSKAVENYFFLFFPRQILKVVEKWPPSFSNLPPK